MSCCYGSVFRSSKLPKTSSESSKSKVANYKSAYKYATQHNFSIASTFFYISSVLFNGTFPILVLVQNLNTTVLPPQPTQHEAYI